MTARTPEAQAIYEDALANPRDGRRQSWTRTEPRSEAEAQRWLDAHPVDPALQAVGEWQDDMALRVDEYEDPLFDRDRPNPLWGSDWDA